MRDLDDPQTYRDLDPTGLRRRLREFPHQCRRAWENSLSFSLPQSYRAVENVVILGMGGSAIGGDLLGDLCGVEQGLPVVVCRDYQLPPWVDARSLVIASSYSGDTEETLSAFDQSLKVGARVLALTSGGRLEALARERDLPVFTIPYVAEPRAALAWSFVPMAGILSKLGLLRDLGQALAEAVDCLTRQTETLNEQVPLAQHPAKELATKLHGYGVVIYGAGFLSAVARRWKTQINENAKAWAFFELLPELNHNSVEGYRFPQEFHKVFVLLLRSPSLHPRVLARYDITRELLAQNRVRHDLVEAEGQSPLAQMLSILLFGDYVSFYLALLNGVDPAPTPAINSFKGRLAVR